MKIIWGKIKKIKTFKDLDENGYFVEYEDYLSDPDGVLVHIKLSDADMNNSLYLCEGSAFHTTINEDKNVMEVYVNCMNLSTGVE